MGKNSGFFRKKIKYFSGARAAIGIAALVLIFIAPASALADNPPASASNTWTKPECDTVSGSWELVDAATKTYDCYTKEVPSPITVSIGKVTGTTTLTKYVAAFYNYMVAGAAVLAVIYIMIGGFQILYSAGGGEVGEGRKKITNAILGLVLVFCSYVLLQTVNPALVNLQSPRIKLIKANYLAMLKPTNMIGQPCYDIRDAEACKNSCPAAGLTASCECITEFDQGIIGTISQTMASVAIGAVTISSIGVGTLRAVVNAVGKPLLRAVPAILSGAVSNWQTVAGAYIAYKIVEGPDPGKKGICLPMAVNSIPVGGECALDHPNGCIAPAICTDLGTDPPIGMCVSGMEGTGCVTNSPTFMINSTPSSCVTSDLQCCSFDESFSDFFIKNKHIGTCYKLKDCNQRILGMDCSSDSQCVSGLKCALSASLHKNVCSSSAAGAFCVTNNDCDNINSGWYCPLGSITAASDGSVDHTSAQYKAFETCRPKEGVGVSCCLNSDCLIGSCTSSAKCTLSVVNGQYNLSGTGTCK